MKLYGSSWDITKAFDSVSKAIIRLAWARLSVPLELIEWLVELGMDAWVAVRTLWMVNVWETQGMAGFDCEEAGESPFTFNPERGTGRGEIRSPHTWVAVFDILLRALEEVASNLFLLESSGGGMYPAPEVGWGFKTTLTRFQCAPSCLASRSHCLS